MSNVDTRQLSRDSLFVLATVRVDGDASDTGYPVKVRNLSSGGMMADGNVKVARGAHVRVELRNVGWVEGTVAWKQDERFGIAFVEDIDHLLVRKPPKTGSSDDDTPRFVRTPMKSTLPEASKLRKI